MARAFFFKTLFFFFYRILFRKIKSLRRNVSNVHSTTSNNANFISNNTNNKFHKFQSLSHSSDLSESTVVFNVEGSLLRSSSLFPYLMLVAFEAGGLIRALVLFLTYPLLTALTSDEESKLRAMVFICFVGIKKDGFRAGSAVLPKFFLEDVGSEGFEMVRRAKKRVASTKLPLVMVESFLRDYLQVESVFGRDLKVFRGYYLGLMDDSTTLRDVVVSSSSSSHSTATIGVTDFRGLTDHQLLSLCQDIYVVSRSEKSTWQALAASEYPKPLIFHDGRLAARPTPAAALQLVMWGPVGLVLACLRIAAALSLPYAVSIPILAFSGLRLTSTAAEQEADRRKLKAANPKGLLYVCNHRTLLDPLYLCFALKAKMTALTYSLSRMSEILAPIKTVRLSRDRLRDSAKMEELLSRGDVVVCPEGTTCREAFLLRFSPLFSEIADEVVPVAVDTEVGMFHGTTAGGLKCLDPVFFLMNPAPSYTVRILERMSTCRDSSGTRFGVANRVQKELGDALGFQCTSLSRRDKYLILAGNDGIVNAASTSSGTS